MLKKGRAKLSRRVVQVKLKWRLYRRKKKASHRATFYFAPSFLTELLLSILPATRRKDHEDEDKDDDDEGELFPLRLQLLRSRVSLRTFPTLLNYSVAWHFKMTANRTLATSF